MPYAGSTVAGGRTQTRRPRARPRDRAPVPNTQGPPAPKPLGLHRRIKPKPMAKGSAAPRGAERWISSRDVATGDGDATSWLRILAVIGALRPSRQQAKLCGFTDHKPDCEQPGNIHTACARPLLYRPSPRKARGSHDKPGLPRTCCDWHRRTRRCLNVTPCHVPSASPGDARGSPKRPGHGHHPPALWVGSCSALGFWGHRAACGAGHSSGLFLVTGLGTPGPIIRSQMRRNEGASPLLLLSFPPKSP